MYNPDEDGITHINIYTKGKTEVGRLLTNLSDVPVNSPKHGKFKCVEGFWYWYFTGKQYEQFRNYNGFTAKKEGKKLRDDRIDKEGLSDKDRIEVLQVIGWKIRQSKYLQKLMIESELPFVHYYYYGDSGNYRLHELPQYDWITEELERIRKILKEENNCN